MPGYLLQKIGGSWIRPEREGYGYGDIQVAGAWRRIREVVVQAGGDWVPVTIGDTAAVAVNEFLPQPDSGFDDVAVRGWYFIWQFNNPAVDWFDDAGDGTLRVTATATGGFQRCQLTKTYPAGASQKYEIRVRAKSTTGTNRIAGLCLFGNDFNVDFFQPSFLSFAEGTLTTLTTSYAWYTFTATTPASTTFIRPGFNIELPVTGNQVLVSDCTIQRIP